SPAIRSRRICACAGTAFRMSDARPVALVTGGAGGLGSAICTKLASDGMRVVVGYHHSADAAQHLVTTLKGDGHSARPAPVTDTAALTALAAAIAHDYGRCDV